MKCQCIPWALQTDQGQNKVKLNFPIFSHLVGFHSLRSRERELCSETNFERQKLFGSLYWPVASLLISPMKQTTHYAGFDVVSSEDQKLDEVNSLTEGYHKFKREYVKHLSFREKN